MGLIAATSTSSNAVELAISHTMGKPSIIIPLKAEFRLPHNDFSIFAGVDILPFYSDIVGYYNKSLGKMVWDTLLVGEANIAYNFRIPKSGNFIPTISPYVGYKHYFAFTSTTDVLNAIQTKSTSNVGGINYGLIMYSVLPNNLGIYLQGGATTMLNGSWTQENLNVKGDITTNSLTLPYASIGAKFNLFNTARLDVGYGISYMPDIRTPLSPVKNPSLVHSVNLGLSISFFSI